VGLCWLFLESHQFCEGFEMTRGSLISKHFKEAQTSGYQQNQMTSQHWFSLSKL
jgi:hypothetical protein